MEESMWTEISNIASLVLVLSFLYVIKPKWLDSIKSVITVMIGYTFCRGFMQKIIDAKDFMLITSLVFNFYFLVKGLMLSQNGKTEVK